MSCFVADVVNESENDNLNTIDLGCAGIRNQSENSGSDTSQNQRLLELESIEAEDMDALNVLVSILLQDS